MHTSNPKPSTLPWERFLAVAGVVICLAVTNIIWRNISAYQPMWPLPGFYLVEIAGLSILAAFAFFRSVPIDGFITWGSVGLIGAFCLLAALSVGFYYVPVAFIFAIISLTRDLRSKQRLAAHLLVCFLAAIGQTALTFAAIRLLSPGAIF